MNYRGANNVIYIPKCFFLIFQRPSLSFKREKQFDFSSCQMLKPDLHKIHQSLYPVKRCFYHLPVKIKEPITLPSRNRNIQLMQFRIVLMPKWILVLCWNFLYFC